MSNNTEATMSNQIEYYDLEHVYDEQISPLMKQIIEICKANKLPMIASFAFQNSEEKGAGDCGTLLIYEGRNVKKFAQALNIIRHQPLVSAITIVTKEGQQ